MCDSLPTTLKFREIMMTFYFNLFFLINDLATEHCTDADAHMDTI